MNEMKKSMKYNHSNSIDNFKSQVLSYGAETQRDLSNKERKRNIT